jgi:hypothetical protein
VISLAQPIYGDDSSFQGILYWELDRSRIAKERITQTIDKTKFPFYEIRYPLFSKDQEKGKLLFSNNLYGNIETNDIRNIT